MKIELRGVSKAYGGIQALDRVSCELGPGQVVAVLGNNGAGKTTLLRCLAGIVGFQDGLVMYDDETFTRDRLDLRRRLHFVPDFPFFFAGYNVVQQVGLSLRIYEVERPGLEDRVVELLRDFDLLALADRPAATLSRGQIYKSALTGLMAVDPELWLVDEPFASGMDPHGLQVFRREAGRAAGQGRTVVYTTQILEVAERFADRVMILHRGEVWALDTLSALQERVAREGSRGGGTLEEIFRQLRAEEA